MADGNVTMSNDDRLDISEIIDLERYPIGELDGSGSRVVRRCRAELAEDGACQLDGFIRPVAAQAVLEEAEMASGKAFRTDATNLDADPPYLVSSTFQKGSFATIAGTCKRKASKCRFATSSALPVRPATVRPDRWIGQAQVGNAIGQIGRTLLLPRPTIFALLPWADTAAGQRQG